MTETIRLGGLELRFLQTKDGTEGGLDAFEMVVQPNARMPVPHYHESWDELAYGLSGHLVFRVDGKDVTLGPARASSSGAVSSMASATRRRRRPPASTC